MKDLSLILETELGNWHSKKEIINSGNVAAMQCLMEHYVNETRAVGEAKRLEQINTKLQLENKQFRDYYQDYEIY